MKLLRRAFQGETDLKQMFVLVHDFPDDNTHLVDLPYRFSSWALDDPSNVALWFDGSSQSLAWAVLQTPFWTVDCAYHPEEGGILFPEILAWADLRAREAGAGPYGRPMWLFNVFRDQLEWIQALEEAGFANLENVENDSWSKVLLVHSSALSAHHSHLPKHFILRPLAGEADVGRTRPRKRDFAKLNLHLELFTVPSTLVTSYEVIKTQSKRVVAISGAALSIRQHYLRDIPAGYIVGLAVFFMVALL